VAAPGRIWLTGLMGSGKSTLGAALAARLGWPHVDNDVALAQATGRPLGEWAPGDELHAAEDALLAHPLLRETPVVADVPAGTADRISVLSSLRDHGAVVYLRAPVTILVARCLGTARPLGADPARALHRQWDGRDATYAATADLVVDATLPPAQQVDSVLRGFDLPSDEDL
jgi:shikimate kinase